MKISKPAVAVFAFVVAIAGSSVASDVTIPHNFTAKTKALASEVNANFAAVQAAVNDNNAKADEAWLADGVAVAATPNSSALLTSADVIVRTVSVTAPLDGTVVANFQTWFTCTSGVACVARCTINPGGSTLDTTRFAITSVASGQYQTMSVQGALPIAEGASLTLNAVCDTFTGTGSLGDMNLVAVYSAKDVSS